MRRKSERVREKDKSSEKKVEKSPKKTRRSSRRRKKTSSSSEESETDDYDTSFKSCKDEIQEETVSGRSVPERNKTSVDHTKDSALREVEGKDYHSKKHSSENVDDTNVDHEEKKDGQMEETPVAENVEKHKESDSEIERKSSVWQVKTTEGSDGEISKLKLCIVRPPEAAESEPRKRKKLSRIPHREQASGSEDVEEKPVHEVQEEKHESQKIVCASVESIPEERNLQERKPKTEIVTNEDQQVDSIQLRSVEKPEVTPDTEIQEDKEDLPGSAVDNEEQSGETEEGSKTLTSNISCFQEQEREEPTKLPTSEDTILVSRETRSSSSEKIIAKIDSTPEEQESSMTCSEDQQSSDASKEKSGASDTLVSGVGKNELSHVEALEEIVDTNSNLKPKDLEREKIKNQDTSDEKVKTSKSSEKPIESAKKTSCDDSTDSEEERKSLRSLQVPKKKSHHLTRHNTYNLADKEIEKSTPEEVSVPKVEHQTNKTLDVQNSSKSTKKPGDQPKAPKHRDLPQVSTNIEKRNYDTTNKNDIFKDAEKPHVKEKVSLKRTMSRLSDCNSSNAASGKEDESIVENTSVCTENSITGSEVQPSVTRKRRWGASRSTSTIKKPSLSISSDCLKHLIPEVKPLSISEVHLTEDEDEEEEGEVLDRGEESGEVETELKTEKRKEEAIAVDKKSEEKELLYPLPMVPKPPEGKSGAVRKISIVSSDNAHLQRSPSPARHRVTNILYITNLVRPFTVNQLRELLARTGSIVDNGFWIDKIKSKCYVQYETETEAKETRHALHGVRWPVSNPKQLHVDYAKKEDMDLARDLAEGNHIPRKTEPLKVDHMDGWLADQTREKERESTLRQDRDRDRGERVRGKDRYAVAAAMEAAMEKTREAKMPVSIREWDLGKMDLGSFDDRGYNREDRNEREHRLRKERSHRSLSREPVGRNKIRKKEEEAPAKLLDDLFKKTKVTPCVYWLPLTADQIVIKEEMRRKHMAEHERRMAEMRKAEKAERERHRARLQGRSSQRKPDDREREKRRHRSPSASPKK